MKTQPSNTSDPYPRWLARLNRLIDAMEAENIQYCDSAFGESTTKWSIKIEPWKDHSPFRWTVTIGDNFEEYTVEDQKLDKALKTAISKAVDNWHAIAKECDPDEDEDQLRNVREAAARFRKLLRPPKNPDERIPANPPLF